MKKFEKNTNKRAIIIAILIGTLIIGSALFMTRKINNADYTPKEASPVAGTASIKDGIQIIEIMAKGGFNPRISTAKAGIPTILRIKTRGTFDCSSVVRIPSLDVTKNLPATGTTDVDLGTQEVGTIYGSCGMGMYPFEIRFE